MKTLKQYGTLLLLLCATVAYAQSSVKGKILDQKTAEPLVAALVSVSGTNITTVTSETGDFELKSENPITAIEVSYIGYESQKIAVTNSEVNLRIEMVSTNLTLKEVTVTGHGNDRKLLETSGSVATLGARELQRGDNTEILPAINTIPGVKMEAYTLGNYRISIRGSLLNNPWGIRNLRIYWNDIPISSPDGTASHALDFDPATMGTMEVLKGPSGSMYGSGNGGVILFKSAKGSYGKSSIETGFTAGSYGLRRFNTTYKAGGENFNICATQVTQRYNGYRENSWGEKDFVNLYAQIFPSEKRTINLFVNIGRGGFGIAGGLNREQVDTLPTQAGQFNKNNKISVKNYTAHFIGVSQVYRFSEKFSNATSVYGTFQSLDHPYGSSVYYNGYFRETTGGFGSRTKFVFAPDLGKVKSRFSLGAEYQYQFQHGNTYRIEQDVNGTWPEPGDEFQNDEVISVSKMIFAQAEFDLPAQVFLTLGASYTDLSFDITDLYRDSTHVNYSGVMDFPEKILPRIGVVKVFNDNLALHGSMSYGCSAPPVWELNNYDGTLNTGLNPEDGVNYELGARGNVLNDKLNFDVSIYHMTLTNAIVPVANQYGASSYVNAGSTDQKGLEAMVSYIILNDETKPVSLLKAWVSFTNNKYTFSNYKSESFDWNTFSVVSNDYSGKNVTGVVPLSVAAGVDLETRFGLYFNTVFYYYDKAPINDANTYYSEAYSLLNAKLGFRKEIKQFGFEVSGGVNNALDTQYSSLILFNADATAYGASPSFYNPSPGINFYGGVKVKYMFK